MKATKAVTVIVLFVMTAMLLSAGTATAALVDRFGGWVNIGQPGNEGDTAVEGYGGVDYSYHIAKYEVSDNDYEEVMNDNANGGTDKPKGGNIDLYAAMDFANRLTEQAGNTPLYDEQYGTRASRAELVAEGKLVYAVPTEDEWYKAAYYSLDESSVGSEVYYDFAIPDDELVTVDPWNSDYDDTLAPPDGTGGWNYNKTINALADVGFSPAEQNGTHDMMGNILEWMEDPGGVQRGGSFTVLPFVLKSSESSSWINPGDTHDKYGFRVVAIAVPEPTSLLLLGLGSLVFLRRRRA